MYSPLSRRGSRYSSRADLNLPKISHNLCSSRHTKTAGYRSSSPEVVGLNKTILQKKNGPSIQYESARRCHLITGASHHTCPWAFNSVDFGPDATCLLHAGWSDPLCLCWVLTNLWYRKAISLQLVLWIRTISVEEAGSIGSKINRYRSEGV